MDFSDENGDSLEENELVDAEELFEDTEQNIEGDNEDTAKRGDEDDDDDAMKKEKPKVSTKRILRNPRVLLNYERLKGPNGFDSLVENFEKFKFKGKYFEKEDLTAIMKIMQHWMCHHLYPGYDIETCMKALEKLGRKRVIQTHMRRMRQDAKSGSFWNKENVKRNNSDCLPMSPLDDFDELLTEEPVET